MSLSPLRYHDDRGNYFIIERKALRRFCMWRMARRDHVVDESKLEDVRAIHLDLGGMVKIKEPEINVEVGGTKFNILLRHIPYFIEFLADKGANKDAPRCVAFSQFPGFVVFMRLTTLHRLLGKLRDALEKRNDELRDIEEDLFQTKRKAGVLDLAKCSCQSGKLYSECHGRES